MNRPLTLTVLTLAALASAPRAAHAVAVSVEAIADSRVVLSQPNTAFPSGSLFADKQGEVNGGPASELVMFYAQFSLPPGVTGASMASVSNIQLAISRDTASNFSLTYYVYGVKDGQDTASADTYTWNSGVGYDPSHTLMVFPAANEIPYYSDPAKSSFVGTLDTGVPGSGPFNFAGTPQSPTAATALQNLLLSDTDGRITFFVGIRPNFGVDPLNTFASIDSAAFAGPTLSFDYVVPEPATCGMLAFGSIAFARLRRR